MKHLEDHKRSLLEHLGMQALLPGLTMAADKSVELLNELRANLKMAPAYGVSGVFAAFDTPGVFATTSGTGKRLGRPPNDQALLAAANGDSPHKTGDRSVWVGNMKQRWSIVKQAGLVIHGSPSLDDVAQAEAVIRSRGEEVRYKRKYTKKGTPRGPRPQVKERFALLRAAGISVIGVPTEQDAERARKLILEHGGIVPAATAPGGAKKRHGNKNIMLGRYALTKQAGMKTIGAPSAAAAERARQIIIKRGGTPPPPPPPPPSPAVKSGNSLLLRARYAIMKEAGLKVSGSPGPADEAKARAIIEKRAMPKRQMTQAQLNALAKTSKYRWDTFKASGLKNPKPGKLPSNALLRKAEKVLAKRAAA